MTSPSFKPLFQHTFGADWTRLPPAIKRRYALRSGSGDSLVMRGHLDIQISPLIRLFARLSGLLISRNGRRVPATVTFRAGPGPGQLSFERYFQFPDGDRGTFYSCMEPRSDGQVLEHMRWGVAWHSRFVWTGKKLLMTHGGFVWCLGPLHVPVPLALLLGTPHAEEWPLSADRFAMLVELRHWLFGRLLHYSGSFALEPEA